MELENITRELIKINYTLRSIRITVVRLALNETKQKHPRVVELENKLVSLLNSSLNNSLLVDEVLEELECLIITKPDHHKLAQKLYSN